jgi:[acyl-carrier-protein] S-malonyltransferase
MTQVALLLPGQGAQYKRMAAEYLVEPVFAEAMDEVFEVFGPRLRADWLAEEPSVPIDHAAWSQPLLFAVDYAMGRLVTSWGVQPAAVLGHSVGEMAAAVLAGVFRVEDAASLVLDRVARVVKTPPGGMIAVAATVDELSPYLHDGVVIGAVNAPKHVVLAGPQEALADVAAKLRVDGLISREVPSLTAFHSPLVATALEGAEQAFASVERRPPTITMYSGHADGPLDDARDPAFWARQPGEPVYFWRALGALLANGPFVLVEAGPGQGLTGIARRHPAVRRKQSSVALLADGPAGLERSLERAL